MGTVAIHGRRRGQLLLRTSLGQWLPLVKLQKWRIRFQVEQERESVQAMVPFC